jgi:RND superfamily putative drug exporter
MVLFAVLFGLSMDYEVFLLSAVREHWVRTGDNLAAVRRGLAETGGVITSAALIMVCVFASFVLVDNPTIKIFGLGLAAAIVVDATIVRCLLVPATMVLLGRWNWWLPRWLDRLLPHVLGHRAHAPEPEARPVATAASEP